MNMRKHIFFIIPALLFALQCKAQLVQSMEVELYYIADSNDESSTSDDEDVYDLQEGSKTYRVFVELCDSCKLRGFYGSENKPFSISCTDSIFNHTDRGELFGSDIGDNRLDENTVALDSWLSFGASSEIHYGILKTEDVDGSILGGDNNDVNALSNDNSELGIPLTTSDGLAVDSNLVSPEIFGSFPDEFEQVFEDGIPSDIRFDSEQFEITTSEGVGLDSLGNKLLVAQITTYGNLDSLCLNLLVEDQFGVLHKITSSQEGELEENEQFSAYLKYPPQCGCTDSFYLEYDPAAVCDDGTCVTEIIYGCNDPEACNYDPDVNLNIPELCCILPDNCGGLNPELICPDASLNEIFASSDLDVSIYPNPFSSMLTLKFEPNQVDDSLIEVVDILGQVVHSKVAKNELTELDLSFLERGHYVVIIRRAEKIATRKIIKS